MEPPDEMMTQAFLPSMRQLVAIRLRDEGFSQNRISALLGITQASVSMYLSAGPERARNVLGRFALTEDGADAQAGLLADAVRAGSTEGVGALMSLWTDLLGSGAACAYHRELHPSLADCDVCIKEYGSRSGSRPAVIAEVAKAVKLLEASPDFVSVMPEVSVNIACSAAGGSSPADVVAIPGRIVRVRDRAKAMLPPEAGASAHMSRVLLMVRDRRPDLRACINIRFDGRMADVVKRHRLRTISIGEHSRRGSEDATAEALRRKLRGETATFDAVVDQGGSGIEPNLYLFGKGAQEVAELALKLARAYSAD
jgi:predicted fused transcriptional regulator/phosphomethylpyrimidine kinase/predicted transcriptional regulator